MAELPQMGTYSHTHSTYAGDAVSASNLNQVAAKPGLQMLNQAQQLNQQRAPRAAPSLPTQLKEEPMAATPRRIVQVYICDPHPDVPLENCILHMDDRRVTDATDQELFFEIDIRAILERHNVMRTKLVDKSVKDRTQHLEPARVRDLKMTVITLASF